MSSDYEDMFEDQKSSHKTIKLYRKNEKDEINLKEISRGMYSDHDAFQEDLDHWFSEGYHDSYQEAKAATNIFKDKDNTTLPHLTTIKKSL